MKSNKVAKVIKYFIPSILIGIMAIMLLVISINLYASTSNWIELLAKLTTVDHVKEKAFVSYVVDAVEYNNIALNEYSSSFAVGQDIWIKYNPLNPGEITSKDGTMIMLYVAIGLMALFLIVTIVSIIRIKKYGVKETNGSTNNVNNMNLEQFFNNNNNNETTSDDGIMPDLNAIAEHVEVKEEHNFVNAYRFRCLNKTKTHFVLESNEGKKLFEGKKTGNGFFKSKYYFVNFINDTSETHTMGGAYSVNGVNKTKFDGEVASEYLAKMGVAVLPLPYGGAMQYRVSKNGKQMAIYSPNDTGSSQSQIVNAVKQSINLNNEFYIDSKSKDYELLFLVGFLICRLAIFF